MTKDHSSSKQMIKESTYQKPSTQEILEDYRLASLSRSCSLLGRKEVLTGKSKFGIFGDGKELAQIVMAKFFLDGDFRSGYYRDQTFMMAIKAFDCRSLFANLYAHTDIEKEPHSAGRQMVGHFATHSLDDKGEWKNLTKQKNSASDISCTAGQIPRLLGLAQASKMYRENKALKRYENKHLFSNNGNEIAWGTIGNGSTSEGHFWETLNAAGVLQVPMILSIWDDNYAISVPNKYQTVKSDISKAIAGFQRNNTEQGIEILRVKGWDYLALIDTYRKASALAREKHIPVVIHVIELTQPQGHSTSGSHERYKSKERLTWEKSHDCNLRFRNWILDNNITNAEVLDQIDLEGQQIVKEAKNTAWKEYKDSIIIERDEIVKILQPLIVSLRQESLIKSLAELQKNTAPTRKEILECARKALVIGCMAKKDTQKLKLWLQQYEKANHSRFHTHVHNDYETVATNIKEVLPIYEQESKLVDGRILIRDNFELLLKKYPELLIFGEDCGKIGDVNQGLEGLQSKFGELRIADTGIRESSIIGQAIGMAMRGLRPIAEVQYLDYILYCIQTLSDDLACLRYRSFGKQKVPMIIRTRGHRLEGVWHSGSPMGTLINLLRGIYVLVPRNMTQAVGFYNTLLESDEPALVIECLNGYRLKEKVPNNLNEIRTPIGKVEILKKGTNITVVSYGATLRIALEASYLLEEIGINAEVIDVQSLLPLDLDHNILESVRKTNRILVVDEDMPGGGASYILTELLDKQNIYKHLDSKPQILTASPHRPAFGSDGDYFSKPSKEDIFEKIYEVFHEINPDRFPEIFPISE